jgi:hypothetical protein
VRNNPVKFCWLFCLLPIPFLSTGGRRVLTTPNPHMCMCIQPKILPEIFGHVSTSIPQPFLRQDGISNRSRRLAAELYLSGRHSAKRRRLALGSAVQCKAATAKANQDMDVDDGLLVGVWRRYVATCQTPHPRQRYFSFGSEDTSDGPGFLGL